MFSHLVFVWHQKGRTPTITILCTQESLLEMDDYKGKEDSFTKRSSYLVSIRESAAKHISEEGETHHAPIPELKGLLGRPNFVFSWCQRRIHQSNSGAGLILSYYWQRWVERVALLVVTILCVDSIHIQIFPLGPTNWSWPASN